MTDDAGNNSFRGRGLFAKYVFSLVGLVLFVLAVNSAIETYFIYRETQSSLVDAMAEKAETTASRIQQFMEETERQISIVTRASSDTLQQRRDDYLLLLRQVPAVSQIFQIDGNGREQLRMNRSTVSVGSGEDFSRATGFSESVAKGLWYGEPFFRDGQAFMSIGLAHPRREMGVSVAELNLRFLSDLVTSGQAGKIGTAYVVSPKGELLASSDADQKRGADLSKLPQVAALIGSTPQTRSTGTGIDGQAVLVAAKDGSRPELARALRAAAQPGVPADQGPADPRRGSCRPRPASGDDRRHGADATDAGADPRAACGRAAPGRRRFRPAHRGQNQG